MPELPEVQTVITTLNDSHCVNKKILGVEVFAPKILKNCTVKTFTKFIVNEKINNFSRVGKYIVCELSNNKILLIHLRMEGKLFCENKKEIAEQQSMSEQEYWNLIKKLPGTEFSNLHPYAKHLRISLSFSDNWFLNYYDSRMFGTFHIYQNISVANIPELTKLGPDALSKEFDSQYLFSITSKTSKSIKTLLMDQQNVAGIGNIYADEILFAAKLNPLKISKQLTLKQCATIVIVTKKILQTAIKAGGTTFATFASANSKIGSYQTKLKVYGREGKPCVVCGTILKKIKVNGRGTVYCPKCQKL